ncbi:hypothetical protein AB0L71_28465 [Streptomyces sp. NPDC052052]|uniref:hypothetical protein n=1 Tax=Streptomyces sp. NPDC052052 TaxID=3154756 RepID=UPI0034144804
MHRFTVDYSKDQPQARALLNRGYFLYDLPRLIALCRLRGHRPIVDGYDSEYRTRDRARWVICDRCGIRPQPQGTLDPDEWTLGQRYTGHFTKTRPRGVKTTTQLEDATSVPLPAPEPGPWPERPTSAIGAQLIIGRGLGGLSIQFKVGNPASEQGFAAHISLGPLGALYVHTEDHGRWIQRRLNHKKWESRETGLRLDNGRFSWRVWAPRDTSSIHDPWWMRGDLHVDPRHYLYGPHGGNRTERSDKTTAVVYLPDDTQHDVTLTLERWVRGRARGKKTVTWEADWSCSEGIPVRFDRSVYGASIEISEEAATSEHWAQEACAAIAAQCIADRIRYGYIASAI